MTESKNKLTSVDRARLSLYSLSDRIIDEVLASPEAAALRADGRRELEMWEKVGADIVIEGTCVEVPENGEVEQLLIENKGEK